MNKEVEIFDLEKSKFREMLKQLHNDSAPTLPDLQKQEEELKQLLAQIKDKELKMEEEYRKHYDSRKKAHQEKISKLEREFQDITWSEERKYYDELKKLQAETFPLNDQQKMIEKQIKDIIDKVGYKRKRIAQIIRLVDSLDSFLQQDPQI